MSRRRNACGVISALTAKKLISICRTLIRRLDHVNGSTGCCYLLTTHLALFAPNNDSGVGHAHLTHLFYVRLLDMIVHTCDGRRIISCLVVHT